MKDWQKIALAGFCGGAMFTLSALLCNFRHLWLAFPLGFIAGYLTYEFRSTLAATRDLVIGVARVLAQFSRFVGQEFMDWFKKPHPFFFLTAPISCIVGYKTFMLLLSAPLQKESFSEQILFGALFSIAVTAAMAAIMRFFLERLAAIGARHEGEFFFIEKDTWITQRDRNKLRSRLRSQGLVEREITYSNVFSWIFGGIFEIFISFATSWFYIFAGGEWVMQHIPNMFIGLWKLVLAFFRFIHSSKRILCGSGGVIGGFASYLVFYKPHASGREQLFCILCGGILGAFGALLEWRAIETWSGSPLRARAR